jgi:uncharacterized membrane protein YtjA (UPF0391 family)
LRRWEITGERERFDQKSRRNLMFGGAAAFLVIALVAAVVDPGIAGMAFNIAWILFLFGLVFEALFAFSKG